MQIKCEATGEVLKVKGAVLLSPPDEKGNAREHYLSPETYEAICDQYDLVTVPSGMFK